MHARAHRRWPASASLLVLGALCLRAFVPAGFMPATVDGRFTLMLCGAGLTPVVTNPSLVHLSHLGIAGDADCPFGQSAGTAPLPALPLILVTVRPDSLAGAAGGTQIHLPHGPPTAQFPRGPPRLA